MTPTRRPRVIGAVLRTFVLAGAAGLALGAPAMAQPLAEGFDTITNGVPSPGWFQQNNSDLAAGTYFQGNPNVFVANAGAATNSYIGANFANTSGTVGNETISNWLETPQLTNINNGDVISFFTRTTTGTFPDRLQLRMSVAGASTNVGTLSGDVGDFTNLLLDINPALDNTSYPTAWTQFTATLAGLSGPVSGRFAFRYFVTNGGVNGANSDYIGIDTFAYTPVAVPEPGSLSLAGAAVIGLVGVRSRRRAAAVATA